MEKRKVMVRFAVPSLPKNFIERSSLKEKASSASKFIYIYGKAGSGKTTFALSISGKNAIYIKIPETKMQDISLIYSYFLSFDSLIGNKFVREAFYDSKRNLILRYVLNEITRKKKKLNIVIDDFHNLSEKTELFKFLRDLFYYASPKIFFIFVSRKNPPAFILKEADRGVFIGGDELNFSANEISYLARKMKIKNVDFVSLRIFELTNGWPLGILLLLKSYKEKGKLLKDYVFSYLMEEVFQKEEKSVRDFMIKTSVMQILIPKVINDYLDLKNSEKILEELYGKGLFVQKTGSYYMYHEIFREFLLNELKKSGELEECIKKLSKVYLKNGKFGLALDLYSGAHNLEGLKYVLDNFTESEAIKYADGIIYITDELNKNELAFYPSVKLVRAEALYAKEKFENALALLSDESVYKGTEFFGRYLLLKIRVLNSTGMFKDSLNLIGENWELFRKNSSNISVGILYELSRAKFFSGEEETSLKILEGLLKKSDAVKDVRLKIKILNAYSLLKFHDKGKYEEAERLYKSIVALSEENGIVPDPITLANVSLCENDLGRREESFRHINKALRIAKDLGWTTRVNYSEIALGHYLLTIDQYNKAISIFKDYINNEDPYLSSSALFGIAEALRKKGIYERAEYYELKDLEMAKEMDNALIIAQSYFQLGAIYFGENKKQPAERCLKKSLEYAEKSGNVYEVARAKMLLAALLELSGKPYEGYFASAKKIIEDNRFYYIIYAEKFFLYPFLMKIGETEMLSMVSSVFGESDLRIITLGRFNLVCSGTEVTKKVFKREKERKIFQLILSEYPNFVSQDLLIDTFFREMEFKKAKHNLSVLISEVRRSLLELCGREIIVKTPEGYGLEIKKEQADFLMFEFLSKQGLTGNNKSDLQKAVKLYKGDFLPEVLYEDWSVIRRERLYSVYLDVLFALSEITQNERKRRKYLEKILEKDEINEKAAYELMRYYISLGEKEKAVELYKKFEEKLLKDYGMNPGEKLKKLYNKISLNYFEKRKN